MSAKPLIIYKKPAVCTCPYPSLLVEYRIDNYSEDLFIRINNRVHNGWQHRDPGPRGAGNGVDSGAGALKQLRATEFHLTTVNASRCRDGRGGEGKDGSK